MLEVFLDSLIDSAKVFGLAFLVYFLLSFFEGKLARLLESKRRYAPAMGALAGAIPQCGIPVVGSDLFLKGHLTAGTLLAIFFSCSDEAFPILLGNFEGDWWMAFLLLLIKIVGGAAIGYLLDLILRDKGKEVDMHLRSCEGAPSSHIGCCGHEIEAEGPFLKEHLLHPFLHSLKIFAYSFLVSFLFGILVFYVGEESILSFLEGQRALTPLLALLVGLIPNCASSVLLSTLYVGGGLPFGALLAGLAMNAGLGPLYLLKDRTRWKEKGLVFLFQALGALALGYSFLWL